MSASLVRAPRTEPSVRLRRSPAALRFGWGSIGGGVVLILVAVLLFLLGLPLVAVPLLLLGVLAASFGGFVLFRERSVRACASCGERFGRAIIELAYPVDEQRYVLAIVDSSVYHRLSGLEPPAEGAAHWLSLHTVYCARCFRVGEITVRFSSPEGATELRGASLIGGDPLRELLATGGLRLPASTGSADSGAAFEGELESAAHSAVAHRSVISDTDPAAATSDPVADTDDTVVSDDTVDTEPIVLALPVQVGPVPPAPWSLPLTAAADESEGVTSANPEPAGDADPATPSPTDDRTHPDDDPLTAAPQNATADVPAQPKEQHDRREPDSSDEATALARLLGFTDEEIPSDR